MRSSIVCSEFLLHVGTVSVMKHERNSRTRNTSLVSDRYLIAKRTLRNRRKGRNENLTSLHKVI